MSKDQHNKNENDLHDEILSTLAKVQDEGYKAVLLLQMKVFTVLSKKLDAILDDDATLKRIVLNGHQDSHHEHHTFLESLVKHQQEHKDQHVWVAAKMKDALGDEALLQLAKDRHKHGGYCDYAKKQMEEEALNKKSKRTIFENVSSNFLWMVIVILIGIIVGKELHF
jgi:hypothetical protein